ncbi:MAG: hypothetical protein C0417_04515 [Chlorobiaceae bacterium]|nr:hypothetical protein [Chlorobiaceae bacterium]
MLELSNDNLKCFERGNYSIDKYKLLSYYLNLFSKGMKQKWDKRVFIDLYSGPGCFKIKGTKKIFAGSPLLVLTVKDPFDKYIYCDINSENIDILKRRIEQLNVSSDISYIVGNCNDRISEIIKAIPKHSKTQKVLSFCFVDPPDIGLYYSTIKILAEAKFVDFLVLLAFGMDVKRNIPNYLKPSNDKIEKFLGIADWRSGWTDHSKKDSNFSRFLISEFERQMFKLGYMKGNPKRIKLQQNNVPLYHLAFYSRDKKGIEFWNKAILGSFNQGTLDFSNGR